MALNKETACLAIFEAHVAQSFGKLPNYKAWKVCLDIIKCYYIFTCNSMEDSLPYRLFVVVPEALNELFLPTVCGIIHNYLICILAKVLWKIPYIRNQVDKPGIATLAVSYVQCVHYEPSHK